MSGAITAAVIGAGATAYAADQASDAAKAAAGGGQVQPWGNTGPMMDELLNDAWQQFKWGNFQFGPDPGVYNAYLDWGGNKLGIDTSGFQRIDPNAGYGPEAYNYMLNMIQGPAWSGRTQSQPVAPTADPWAAAVLGGLGGYAGAGGFDPQPAQTQGSIHNIQGYQPPYYQWTNAGGYTQPDPGFVPSWQQSIPGVPGPGG